MEQRQHLKLTLSNKTIEFDLEIDIGFIQDRNLMHCLRNEGCCEPEVTHVMARALRQGDVAIDAGAAIGFFSCVMARLVGDTGKVIAVEPAPNNVAKLRQNLKINGLGKVVQVVNNPIWSALVERPFFMYDDSGSNSLRGFNGAYKSAPILKTVTLDGLINGAHPRLLKIDCEGAEGNIVAYSASLTGPSKIPFVLMELNQQALEAFDTSPRQVCERMLAYGYQLFILHRDGVLPTHVPQPMWAQLRFTRANTNVLFSTWERVGEIWPDILA